MDIADIHCVHRWSFVAFTAYSIAKLALRNYSGDLHLQYRCRLTNIDFMNPNDFLALRVPGYAQLSDHERHVIQQFSLMWSAFENSVCNTRATPLALLRIPKRLLEAGKLDMDVFKGPLTYFRQRYYQDGHFTHFFEGLHLEEGSLKNGELVARVMSGAEDDALKTLGAILLIVYRYRNNLFHGVKWQYGIVGQQENFQQACNVMMAVMDRLPPAH